MDCSTLGFPVHHQLPELLKLMSIKSVIPYNHLILCRPLLLLPSVFTSIMVFSNEPVLCIRWPKYWSFSLSISPSNEYSGLISFRMDWFDLLTVQGTLENLFQYHSSKASILWCSKIFVYGICILQFYWIFKLVLTVFFLMESLELSIHKIMSSTNVTMYKCTSFLIWMCLISFSRLIAVARTSNIMMNTSSKWVLGSEIPPGCGSLCQGWGLWWNCLRLPYLLCLMCNYHSARLQVFLKEEMVPYEAEDSVLYEGRWVQHLLTLTSSEEFELRIDTTWPRFWTIHPLWTQCGEQTGKRCWLKKEAWTEKVV